MLKKFTELEFDKIYELMKISFPIDEYRPYKKQKDLLNNNKYSIYGLLDAENQIKVFISLWDFDSFIYIEHFAVNPKYRNEGLGSKILFEISCIFNKMICLEVEPPEDEMTKRRINFYQRNNFYFNDYQYIQPPMDIGKNFIKLYIMTSKSLINEIEFNKIKKTLYLEVYNYIE